jgi:hypothetical protein
VFFSFVCDDFAVSLWVIMGKNISFIVQSIIMVVYFIELIIAVRISMNKDTQVIMKKFFFYPLVGVIVSLFIPMKNLGIIPVRISFTVNTVSLLFHYSFLTYFIFKLTNRSFRFKIIGLFFLLILIGLIIPDIKKGYVTSFAFANSCLFIFSLYYFRTLLIGKVNVALKNNPIFYVCCGIFIGSGLIVPSTLMIKYMYLLSVPQDSIFFFAAIWGLGYILMNLIFIKALLLCLKQNK